jgi:hypothetical protein
MSAAAAATSTSRDLPPPPLVALAAWLVPGAGYWLIGQRTRGITIGITIVLLFVIGVFIAGIRVVEAPDLSGPSFTSSVLQRPWFLGQALTGPIGLLAAWGSSAAERSASYHAIESKARIAEIGTLYTAVAGMLNLLAIIDSAHRAGNHGNR